MKIEKKVIAYLRNEEVVLYETDVVREHSNEDLEEDQNIFESDINSCIT